MKHVPKGVEDRPEDGGSHPAGRARQDFCPKLPFCWTGVQTINLVACIGEFICQPLRSPDQSLFRCTRPGLSPISVGLSSAPETKKANEDGSPIAYALKRAMKKGNGAADLRTDILAGIVVGIGTVPLSMALSVPFRSTACTPPSSPEHRCRSWGVANLGAPPLHRSPEDRADGATRRPGLAFLRSRQVAPPTTQPSHCAGDAHLRRVHRERSCPRLG